MIEIPKECPECGEDALRLFLDTKNSSPAADGMYYNRDITPTAYIECIYCSETVQYNIPQHEIEDALNAEADKRPNRIKE
jgi:hypothetical protein